MAADTEKNHSKALTRSTTRDWNALTPPLAEWILEATAAMGFERMTPVQANTIPLFKGNKDVVVEAVTGSGKTLAFLIPVVERLLKLEEPIRKHHIGAIIISPTRELATQIHSVLLPLLAFHEPSSAIIDPPNEFNKLDGSKEESEIIKFPSSTLKVVPQLLLGGTSSPAQDLSYFLNHSPNLIISTPGRLLELLSSSRVHCPQSSFEVLVLDEADRLLDLGFKEDLQKILQRLPKQRRTGLFSASVSEAVDQLVRVGLRNPVRIAVKVKSASGAEDKKTPSSLQMTYIVSRPTHKLPHVARILHKLDPRPQKSIVYLSTCAAVDYFSHLYPSVLNRISSHEKITIIPLHGKQTPAIRQKNFTRFLISQSQTVLLTTDVAARGLDIPTVDLVVQVDPPSDPKVFLHRCGRAGRAGRRGLAVVILTEGREEDYVPLLAVRQTPVEPLSFPSSEDLTVSDAEAFQATKQMRELIMQDRSLHEKGQRAFVSWVQSYSKHAASSIFRVQDLDWQACAEAWGLIKMPRMPELKKAKWTGAMDLGLSVDWKEYGYKDKKREEKRRKEMLEVAEDGGVTTLPARKRKDAETQSWSDQKAQQKLREERREKKRVKMESIRKSKMSENERQQDEELREMVEKVKKLKREERDTEFAGFGD